MSKKTHECGSDRIAEAVENMDVDVVVNVQGDEPFIEKESLAELLAVFENEDADQIDLVSLKTALETEEDIQNPNHVKVITNKNDYALYFSRSPIPYLRNKEAKISPDKIVSRTGINITSSEDIVSFSNKCNQIASSLNISEAWELLLDEERILTAKEIADSCIDHHGYPEYIVAVYLAINSDSIYFEQENHGFKARSSAQVKEILIGRERLAKIERDETDLLTSLEKGLVPESFTQHQMESLNHIREFAIHGDEYRRSVRAQELLKRSTTGNASQLQRHSFEILVKAGVLAEDDPLEIERAGIPTVFSKPVMQEVKSSIHQIHPGVNSQLLVGP